MSVLRCDAALFGRFRATMAEAEPVPRPGIEAMPGLLAHHAGATSSPTDTNVRETPDAARRTDRFEPMLEPGRRFAGEGAAPERPVTNHATLRPPRRCQGAPAAAPGKEVRS